MARRKGDRVIDGKVVHADETETFNETESHPEGSSTQIVPVPVETGATGIDLQKALEEDMESGIQTIVLKIEGRTAPQVTMTGYWSGGLLKAAFRAIEAKYHDVRRHATVWAMKKAQQNKAV